MNKSELPFLTASELSKLMAAKEVSPVEATEAYLDRIEALDAKYRAYVTVAADAALAAAKRAEQEIAQGNHRGPMHGVPVAAKDQINTQGILTTGGSPVFKDNIPTFDATVIANLKAAGAVLLGKLNMTEFATSGLSLPAIPGTWIGQREAPAAAPARPRQHFYVLQPWAKTPVARCGSRRPGAAWLVSARPGAGSAALG